MDCRTDIMFVLHESGNDESVNFHLMKWFVWEQVDPLDIDSGNTRFGLVIHSPPFSTAINLKDHSSVAGLQSDISSLKYIGRTDTAAALEYVRTVMLTSAAGDRSDVPNVVVIVTDGISDNLAAMKVKIKFGERCQLHVKTDIHYAIESMCVDFRVTVFSTVFGGGVCIYSKYSLNTL